MAGSALQSLKHAAFLRQNGFSSLLSAATAVSLRWPAAGVALGNERPYGSMAVPLNDSGSSGDSEASSSHVDSPASLTSIHDLDTMAQLTPRAVVERLDRFIVGQADAKRAVAVAFRNRWRRHRVPAELKDEIVPKNILMIGPTGCGKTEIARRLAKLADSPFVKVEATKYTEVGYHGRDVDQIVRDLVENAITLVRLKLKERAAAEIGAAVEERIVTALLTSKAAVGTTQEALRLMYRNREVEDVMVDVEVPSAKGSSMLDFLQGNIGAVVGMSSGMEKFLGGKQSRRDTRKMSVAEARPMLEEAEAERLFPTEVIHKEAVKVAEQDGIIFIDEIDKIVSSGDYRRGSGDPSSEGVQRDLLPIIEGSVVSTKYGNVSTDHMLFICSGAFHSCKPSDMMAELQGRLPIRVELKGLTREDFYRILQEPEYNMIKQQKMLLEAEGVDLHFTEAAIQEIAAVAEELNRTVENIGARRLHTVLERIVEEISFSAPEKAAAAAELEGHQRYTHVIDKEQVVDTVGALLKRQDLSKYII